jgi:hypothetical protein
VKRRGASYEAARDRLIARLSESAADITALRGVIEPMQAATAVPDFADFHVRGKELRARVEPMREALRESPALDAVAAKAVDGLDRAVRAAANEAEKLTSDADLATVRSAAVAVTNHLDTAYDAILGLFVPYYVREQLHTLGVGRALLLATVYSDHELRLPSQERRLELLARLENDRSYMDEGIVDVEHERIWRKSSSRAARAASYAAPIVFAVLGGGLAWLATKLELPEGLGLDDFSELLTAYVLVLAGVAAHLIVENVKQFQAKAVPVVAIGRLLDWLHLRWAAIAWTFFLVLVTVVGLRASLDIEAKDNLLYLFAGYSIDSVAGIFLTRFGTAAASGVSRLHALIGAPPPAS